MECDRAAAAIEINLGPLQDDIELLLKAVHHPWVKVILCLYWNIKHRLGEQGKILIIIGNMKHRQSEQYKTPLLLLCMYDAGKINTELCKCQIKHRTDKLKPLNLGYTKYRAHETKAR